MSRIINSCKSEPTELLKQYQSAGPDRDIRKIRRYNSFFRAGLQVKGLVIFHPVDDSLINELKFFDMLFSSDHHFFMQQFRVLLEIFILPGKELEGLRTSYKFKFLIII